jgi:hypothetical protein
MRIANVHRFLVLLPTILSSGFAAAATVATTRELSFGTIARSGAGTVIQPSSGARDRTGDVLLIGAGPGSPALFSVSGNDETNCTLSLPDNQAVALDGNGAPVINFEATPATFNLPLGSPQSVAVGATLNLSSVNPTPGGYTATFEVTVTCSNP